MARTQLKGLDGLRGLSGEEYNTWRNAQIAAGKLNSRSSYRQEQILYDNQQYIAKYGIDAFNAKSYQERKAQWDYDIVQPEFFKAFNPFFNDDENERGVNGELYDASKGMGSDYFKYNLMSIENKRKLLESDWLTPSEITSKINARESRDRDASNALRQSMYQGGAPSYSYAAVGGMDFFREMFGNPIRENWDRKSNDNILASIWDEDLKEKAQELKPVVDAYYSEVIAPLSDSDVKEQFMRAIKPGEGQGAPYIYSAYFNDDGTPSEDEVEKFSIDDMRQFLARKAVYDEYMGPNAGYDALNNQGKVYISDHQSWLTYSGLLVKDIGISTLSYTADKWNAMRRMTLMGQDAEVYMTDDGQIVPTADVEAGKYEGVNLHKETLSLIALDDMGYAPDGTKRGWFNNAQFWTNAEQYGTMDEEEQAQYSKLGYSPYKVVYKPGDETDLYYETMKMTSFALADVATTFIPAAGVAKGAQWMAKGAEMVGMAGRMTSIAGKTLYYGSKVAQASQGTIAAFGIGNAYGRGVFGELYQQNLTDLEQSIADQAQREVYNSYNTDAEYKRQVDSEIEQEYQRLAAEQQAQINSSEGQYRILDPRANEEVLRSRAMQNVLNRKTQEWANNFKSTDAYNLALQNSIESASDAALTASITTGLKYTFVNNWGYRRFLFKNQKSLASSYEEAAGRTVTETVNSAGKRRLFSKFDFATAGDRAKQILKVGGAQFWGGAWTNATDELQSEGGRQMNRDRMAQYLSGMYDGAAQSTRYSLIDGVASYMHGAASGLANGNTYKAGLVGGLGSFTSMAPNAMNLASLVTKNGRKEFAREWRQHRQEGNYAALANMLVSNGILNEYYAKKQGQAQLMSNIELINKMLDETDDFKAIDDAIALDMASIDATNPEDANAIRFLQGVQAIDMLSRFKEDKEAVKLGNKSSVLQQAMKTISDLSDPSKLSEREASRYLTQYYAANPTVAQSEQQNQIALQELQERAIELQNASEVYGDVTEKLAKIEKDRGMKLPPLVRGKLVTRLTLDNFLERKTAELEKSITGSEVVSTREHDGRAVGDGNTRWNLYSSVFDNLMKDLTKASEEVDKAQEALDNYNDINPVDVGHAERTRLQTALANAKLQYEYVKAVRDRIDARREEDIEASHRSPAIQSPLTKEEIMHLNPEDRAFMLNPENFHEFDNWTAQQDIIKELRDELNVKDPEILKNIISQGHLVQRMRANKRATSMMMENPEAAALQLEADQAAAALIADKVNLNRQSYVLRDAITKTLDASRTKGDNPADISLNIEKNLRVLNKGLLEHMRDTGMFDDVGAELDNAIEWADMLTDISGTVEDLGLEDAQKNAFISSVDGILDKTRTRSEVLDELGRVVESDQVAPDAKAPFEKLLNSLEQLWNQRASTTTTTREEREEAQKKAQDEEAQREAARLEAERKAAELAAQGLSDADADTSKDKDAELQAHGLNEEDARDTKEANLTDEEIQEGVNAGEDVDLFEEESPTIEQQAAAEPDKTEIIETPKDDATDQGNRLSETVDNFQGNIMYGYELGPLKGQGIQQARKGKSPTDKMSRYFAWMEAAGIRMQDIIDQELNEIAQLDQPVYPLYVDYHKNATNDDALSDFMLLAVEYTDDVKAIHNDKLGGVVTSNGKQYLIVGTMGFAPGNKAQGDAYRQMLYEGKVARKQYLDANPSERFFVDTSRHTGIQQITSGRLVRQLTTDSEVQIRSISELLADESRNPKGLTMTDLKWGIQYDAKFAKVNVSDRNTVYPPSDGTGSVGSVFLLVETSNGNYIPAYIKPTRLSEIKDGSLKTQIESLINDLTSPKHEDRVAAEKKLRQLLNLTKEGDWILLGTKDKATVTTQKNGVKMKTFNLTDPAFNREDLLQAIRDLDPRINITTTALGDPTGAMQTALDEAGTLTTDLALLGTSGASYTVYSIDAEGNPVITAPANNATPSTEVTSDLTKAERKKNSETIGKITYRKDENGQWRTDTDKLVTDERLIEQLNYKNLIRTMGLEPSMVNGQSEIFIVNSSKDSPLVIIRQKGKYYQKMTKEGALKIINDVNAEKVEKERQERLKQELEKEERTDDFIANMTEEQKKTAAENGEDVDLFGEDETLTDDQIVNQQLGDFDAKPTPQQETAEKLVEKITTDTSDIQLSEDGKTYVDSSGKHYARVTSVIAADETAGERFGEDNPWGLPSTTIGTGIDEFVRDYFDNKLGNPENLEERYPNATNEQLQSFIKQLDNLKEEFKRRGLTIVPRDVTVSGTVEVTTTKGEKRVIDVAGTLDLLAYDKDGNFYIFDMKTNRSAPNREKGARWAKQLTLYKQLLQAKYGAVVRGMEIIPIQVSYPAPKGFRDATIEYTARDGRLYANGTEYRNAQPTLHNNLPIREVPLSIQFSRLTPVEQAMVRTIEDEKPTPKREVEKAPVVQTDAPKTGEDINGTGTKSLAQLQAEKTLNTALAIMKSKEYGKRVRDLLKAKFPDFPKKTAEIESFLQRKGIPTVMISNVEDWISLVEECK